MYALAVVGLAAALAPADSAHGLVEAYAVCFRNCHTRTGDRGATLVLDVTVGPERRPTAIVVSGLAPPEDECVRAMARRLVFEEPTRVIHSWLLEAKAPSYAEIGVYGRICRCDECKMPPPEPSRPAEPPEPLRIGPLLAVGDIDHKVVRRFLRRQRQKISACWDGKSASAELDVSFRILAGGRASDAKVAGAPSPLGACVAAAVESMQFPGPRRGAVAVRVPIAVGAVAPSLP